MRPASHLSTAEVINTYTGVTRCRPAWTLYLIDHTHKYTNSVPRCPAQGGGPSVCLTTADKDLASKKEPGRGEMARWRDGESGTGDSGTLKVGARRDEKELGGVGVQRREAGLGMVWSVGCLWWGVFYSLSLSLSLSSFFSRETMTELRVGVFVLDIPHQCFFFFFFFSPCHISHPIFNCYD